MIEAGGQLGLKRLILAGFFLAIFVFAVFSWPPQDFPAGQIITIPEGLDLAQISRYLKNQGVVRHPGLFQLIVRISGRERSVWAGRYHFEQPLSVLTVARRVMAGESGIDQIRVTIPEGTTVRQMAEIFSASLPLFSGREFLKLAGNKEGYLFPDTYFFFEDASASDIVKKLGDNFEKKISEFKPQLEDSGRTLEQIITMASLIEEEVHEPEARRIISGILWKRIKLGMALQVDATLSFLFGKTSKELTAEDLEFDSPYNTYKYPGLPPAPITNPGLDSIEAALNPTESDYLYYLSAPDGQTYYAETFEEHKRNKELYLR